MASAKSYGDTVAKAHETIRKARLADPDEHFPYKHAQVKKLVKDNPAAGPDGPDDGSLTVRDFMSDAIADASKDYIDAQAAYLEDPSDEHRAAFEVARDLLVQARQRHRANRVDADGNPMLAVTGKQDTTSMPPAGFKGAE